MDTATTSNDNVKSTSDLMKMFQERFRNRKPEKILYPRQQIIKMFVDRLNSERGVGFRPLKPSFVAQRMYHSGLNDDQMLWWFWGYCNEKFEQSKPQYFSKRWWFSLDAKNVTKI